jgi:hypothetical protein
MMNYIARFLILSLVVLISSNAIGSEDYVIEEGEIWKVMHEGKTKLTTTGKKVDDINVSPTGEYIAYSKIIEYVEDIGDWAENEKPPLVPRHSIVFFDAKNKRELKEFIPLDEPFLDMEDWTSDYSFKMYRSTGLEVIGHYDYNVKNDTTNKISLYPSD